MTDTTQTQTQVPKASDDALALVSKSVESLQGVVDVIKRDSALTDEIRQNVAAVIEALTIVTKLDETPAEETPAADPPAADSPAAEAAPAEETPAADPPAEEGGEQVEKNAGFGWPMDMNDLASNEA
jgi:hypothetical protein